MLKRREIEAAARREINRVRECYDWTLYQISRDANYRVEQKASEIETLRAQIRTMEDEQRILEWTRDIAQREAEKENA